MLTKKKCPANHRHDSSTVSGNTVKCLQTRRPRHHGQFEEYLRREPGGYTELLTESREEAVARMVKQAEAIGANAVVSTWIWN